MPRLHRTITVNRPLEEAFAYVADFTTVSEWDPGVSGSTQTAGNGPGVGATYRVTAVFNGRELPMTYHMSAYEPPARVTLRGEGSTVTAVDDITFKDRGDGTTQIDYMADLRMKGLLRLAEPFLKGAFDKLADKAMAGLERRLA
jgi:carbon monoxide dehydrogenase subunit G